MQPPLELPDLPQNASLLEFLRAQGKPAAEHDDYALAGWELHTHPDLTDRLCELAPGCPLSAAYGIPLLARHGVAAAVALGTSWLAVRIDRLPTHIETRRPAPNWTFAKNDWHVVDPWQSKLSSADGTRAMRDLISRALSYAADLSPEPDQPRSGM